MEPGIPVAVFGLDAVEDVRQALVFAEVVSLTVALVLRVAQFVVELQVCALPEGLAVGGAGYIAAIVARCGVITGGIVGGVQSCLVLHTEKVHFVVRHILVLGVA